MTSGQQERKSKQRKIRNSEYYDMEGTFDRLYAESKRNKTFNHLIICLRKKGGFSLTQNQTPVTTTEHKIGKVTYLVCSSASERATDTLDKKIKKLIRKDMELNPANARK